MCDLKFIADGGNVIYFIAIRVGGKEPFESAQNASCCKRE